MSADFNSPYARYAILVITGLPNPGSPAGDTALREVKRAIDSMPQVSRTVSYLTSHDSTFLSPHGTFIVVGVQQRHHTQADDWIVGLRTTTQALAKRMRGAYPDVRFAWTGNAALNYDFRRATARDAATAERRIVPITLVLLLLVFGSVIAATLPLLAAGLAVVMSLGCAVLLVALHWPLSLVLRNAVSMLGLGAGIDYALLMVSRFREGLASGQPPRDAAAYALQHAGHTVVLSATAVVISFTALLSVQANELRSIATGGLLAVGISALLSTTLLPGILALLGPRIDVLRIRLPRLPVIRRSASSTSGWHAWGRWTAAHPWRVLAVGGVPLLLLGWQATRLRANMPSGDWLPRHAESADAVRTLEQMGKSGLVQSLRVMMVFPDSVKPLSPAGWDAMRRLAATIAADPRVATVRSLPGVTNALHPSATLLSVIPADVLRTFLARGGRETVVEVVPREGVSISAVISLARELRVGDPVRLTGLPGSRVLVGGLAAFNSEYQDEVQARIAPIVGLVVLGSFVALLIGFRSVLVPLKAVALNLLSVLAAFGATVLVFQDGWGVHLFGLSGPVDGLFPAVPLVVFCMVFGFSMDYEVFLVARVAEAAREGADPETAVADGIARTGGVITSAAIIMMVVFAAFAFSDFLLVKVLGFTLAVAILIDATIVRMAVGPALLRLAGRWNWWPGVRGLVGEPEAPLGEPVPVE